MKKLLYIPIIHMEADMGSMAAIIDKGSSQMCGKERWNQHKKTVSGFWDSIANFFARFTAPSLKIYQDGLMVEGGFGKKIVEEGAMKGSKNHKIVLELMERGATIMRTEDPSLLKEEYDSLVRLSQNKSFVEKIPAYIGYRSRKNLLLDKRDKFIAERINETLQDKEVGVLFIGVYHNVLSRISKDIRVYELKERAKVKAYFDGLVRGKDKKRFNQLAEYLASPIKNQDFLANTIENSRNP